ncbi:expressed unknown protein [Seminavis robusta]|uniref:Transmembrane protein n=1 Tax=Seminavis robusta TaxID=568900 RepID=A0A9N8HT76_9STRA|nr:expressed unknown protein [Seminavis robusta]|eukprot:Sro1625_g286740.1 n/a (230) ;mRNA; r:6990-7679
MEATLTQKLLNEEQTDLFDQGDKGEFTQEMVPDEAIHTARVASSLLGICIGIFIQGSTLALSYLLTVFVGFEDTALSDRVCYTVALVWSVVSSMMGVTVLLLMRSILITAFYSTHSDIEHNTTLEAKEELMAQIIDIIQKYYTIGSLFGFGLSWTVADYLLGLKGHLYPSFATLSIAIVWYICPSTKCASFKGHCGKIQDEDGKDHLGPNNDISAALDLEHPASQQAQG